jgi:hypothetical protein
MTLYDFGTNITIPTNKNCASFAFELLDSTIYDVVNMAQHLERALDKTHIDSFSPLVLHSIYKAATILNGSLKTTQKLDQSKAISSLKNLLRKISVRWLAAGKSPARHLITAQLTLKIQKDI